MSDRKRREQVRSLLPANKDQRTQADRRPCAAFLQQQWRPGRSGNPTGRPRNRLEFLVRERTFEGHTLIAFWVRVFRGKEPGSEGRKGLRWRAWASQRLAERGWGKAPLVIESSHEEIRTNEARLILANLSTGALEELHQAVLRLSGDADGVDADANTLAGSSALTAESEIGRKQ